MYDQFYGLQGRPFQLTPDPHYYFESATHRKALSYLGYGLAQGEGFIVITGDIGAGKTTLVGHLMQTIDPARLTAVKIVSTQVEGDDMLRLAAQSFGLSTDGQTKAASLHQIEGFLHAQARAGRRTLLIVDEAQNLPVSAIEELRMLSNFQLGGQSLLQIFLLGQPEFRDLVKSPELEQLRQRVIATHHLEPMMANEVEPYILHRLGIAGWNGNPAFTPAAFAALYAATGGVPRRLNALTSRVLLLGAIEQLHLIDEDVVGAVVADMGLDNDSAPEPVAPSALDMAEDAVMEPVVAEREEAEREEEEVIEPEAVWSEPPVDDGIEPQPETATEPEPEPEPVAPAPFLRPVFTVYETAAAKVEEYDDGQDEAAEILDLHAGEEEPAAPFVPPVASIAAGPFVRPVTDNDPAPLAPLAQEVEEAAPVAIEEEADAPVQAVADVPLVDTFAIEALRSDMLAEIEALRAEIASLRAMQAHAPFAQPTQPEIDPEALKGCFTLIEERLSSLEFRAEEQDTALRRVLTLLVDWVEREEQLADTQAVA
ncbi:XrtA-associated ATPase [Sphingobium sp. HBC34]|uniref:XrtA-associated ATPase n=1 Tax=Sphingobium cyanobacteriorum TaxID=3063954 RepID=A0ABT8ZKG1_9SPHN|nr:XrtA/PEP-CTERM system-associated ATPase [Sphingobium sp. HBC34]MDO7835035.1 XrtA-associated ATPase [Sphingobium sp. HBC34]